MYNKRFTALSLASLCLSAMPLQEVRAQVVDYTGLEELFQEPVTTSATGKPQRVSETPISMQIITSEEIRRSGAVDLPQLLRRVAGVGVTRNFRGHADVSIRGFDQPFANRLLTLVNGRQIYMDNFGMTLWHSLPFQLSEIKQIEVVRGPNTSLFGFNAASGVINIITFNPLLDDVTNVEGRIGTQEYYQAGGVATTQHEDRFGLRASAGRLLADGFSRKSMYYDHEKEQAIDRKNFNVDAAYAPTDTSDFRIEAGVNKQMTDGTMPLFAATQISTIMRHFKLTYNYDSGDYGVWNLNTYHNNIDMFLEGARFYGDRDGPHSNNKLTVFQLSNLFSPTPDHAIRLGGEYRLKSIFGTEEPGGAEFIMDIASANAMWDWRLTDKLTFTNSARVDSWGLDYQGDPENINPGVLGIQASEYDRDELDYSFNSGLVYKPTPVSSYRLSVARGLHIPSLIELARSEIVLQIEGNPRIETESNTTFEIGYDRLLPEQNASFGVNLFYQKLENVIAGTVYTVGAVISEDDEEEGDVAFENVGDASAYGLEVMANGTLFDENLRWGTSYTFLLSDDEPNAQEEHYLDYKSTQPKHRASITLGYTLGDWEFDTDVNYVHGTNFSGVIVDEEVPRRSARVRSHAIMNARVGYNLFENTNLSLDLFNILDEHHERQAFDFGVDTGRGMAGGNRIGRAALFTVRHSF